MSQLPFRVIPQAVPDAPDRLDVLGAVIGGVFMLTIGAALGLCLAAWLL